MLEIATRLARSSPKILVSSPHPISHVRMIKFSPLCQVTYRDALWMDKKQQQLQKHHAFWTLNNTRFQKASVDFHEAGSFG